MNTQTHDTTPVHGADGTTGSDDGISRRAAFGVMGAAGLAVGLGAASSARAGSAVLLSADELGYDEKKGEYTLPELPYGYDALEPHIDGQTMRIHHDRHHAGYVKGLNNAIARLAAIRDGSGDSSLLSHWQRQLSFHGGGHVNHTTFWRTMAPPDQGGGGKPGGRLAEAIDASFGSFDGFASHFKAAAGSVEGSGWAWLAYEPVSRRLIVSQMLNQQNLLFPGVSPILGVDVWEHAYYLKYQNKRGDYVAAFMNVINWGEVGRLYERAARG